MHACRKPVSLPHASPSAPAGPSGSLLATRIRAIACVLRLASSAYGRRLALTVTNPDLVDVARPALPNAFCIFRCLAAVRLQLINVRPRPGPWPNPLLLIVPAPRSTPAPPTLPRRHVGEDENWKQGRLRQALRMGRQAGPPREPPVQPPGQRSFLADYLVNNRPGLLCATRHLTSGTGTKRATRLRASSKASVVSTAPRFHESQRSDVDV